MLLSLFGTAMAAFDIVGFVVGIIVSIIFQAPVLWLVGRWLVGPAKARFIDAVTIVVIGSIVNAIVAYFIGGAIGSLIQLIIYLYLIKRYYETDWIKSIIIAVVTVIVAVVIAAILGLLGFVLLTRVF